VTRERERERAAAAACFLVLIFGGCLQGSAPKDRCRIGSDCEPGRVCQQGSLLELGQCVPRTIPRDFNGDGKRDVLWQDVLTGAMSIWFMDGDTKLQTSSLDMTMFTSSESGVWRTAGIADFNLDGSPDLLRYQTDSGALAIWFMNDMAVTATLRLDTSLDIPPVEGWRIRGIADFNLDGKPDILLYNIDSTRSRVWHMTGSSRLDFIDLDPVLVPAGDGWMIAGTGYFNSDPYPDILWYRPTTGENQIWFMADATRIAYGPYSPESAGGWDLIDIDDLDSDGHSDVLFSNAGLGTTQIWLMTGINRTGLVSLPYDLSGPTWAGVTH
jgi:hypothetical protein